MNQKSAPKISKNVRLDECACHSTRKAARLLGQAYDQALEPSGLTNTQFSTLAAVSRSGGGLTITELAVRLAVDRTTLTRNLVVMTDKGLVSVGAGVDARSKRVALTWAGARALDEAIPLWERVQGSVARGLGDWSKVRVDLARLAEVARGAR